MLLTDIPFASHPGQSALESLKLVEMGKPRCENGSGLCKRWAAGELCRNRDTTATASCRHWLLWGPGCLWVGDCPVAENLPSLCGGWAGYLGEAVIQHSIPGQLQDTSISSSHKRQVQWSLKMQEQNNERALRTCLHANSTLSTTFREWRPLKILYRWEFARVHGALGSVVKNLIYATLWFLVCLSLALCQSGF